MAADDWQAEGKLPNDGLRVRHLPTRAVFDLWAQKGEIHAVLRQGMAATDLFNEAKKWFKRFGKDQPELL